jgi:hypothetical protein
MSFAPNVDLGKYLTIVDNIVKRSDLGLVNYPDSLDIFKANIEYARYLDPAFYSRDIYRLYYANLARMGMQPFLTLSTQMENLKNFAKTLERIYSPNAPTPLASRSRDSKSSSRSNSSAGREEDFSTSLDKLSQREETFSDTFENSVRRNFLSDEPDVIEAPSSNSPRRALPERRDN